MEFGFNNAFLVLDKDLLGSAVTEGTGNSCLGTSPRLEPQRESKMTL